MSESSFPSRDRLREDRSLAVGIFFVVLAFYLLTYDGLFASNNDERALFSGTDSFVRLGAFTINQMYWDYTQVGMITPSGDMVPNYEPMHMVLAVPFYLFGRLLGAGVQGVMLFGAFVTAASVALLYLCILELGYGRRAAVLGAGVYAVATAAWPYSRTFFREPTTALFYLVAFYAVLRFGTETRRRILWPALAGLALGIALTTKEISVAVIPPLLMLAAAYEWRRPRRPGLWRHRLYAAVSFLLPVAVLWALGRAYNAITLRDVTAFARDVVEYATNPQLSSSLPERMLRGGLGLSISPYRGVFWYSPVLLLGLLGAVPLARRRLWEALAFLAVFGLHLLGYSRYLYWSGGLAWGPRYMVPAVPFLVLLAAPVFAWLVKAGPTGDGERHVGRPLEIVGRVGVVLLILLSVGLQVLGVAVDVRAYETQFWMSQAETYGGIGEAIDALYLKPSASPVLGHLRILLSGKEPLDVAWVQLRPEGKSALQPGGLAASLAGVVLAAAATARLWRRPSGAQGVGVVMSLSTLALCTTMLVVYRQNDARFDPYGVGRFLEPMIRELEAASDSGQARCCSTGILAPPDCSGALIVPDPTLTDYFLNYFPARMQWYDIDATPVRPQELDQLVARYSDLWLARDRNAAADDGAGWRGVERYLVDHAYKVSEQQFGDWARLLHFSAAGLEAEISQPGQRLGEIVLEGVTLRVALRAPAAGCADSRTVAAAAQPLADGRVEARAGDAMQIGLTWRALETPAANYSVFLQLLDADSKVKAQRDRWPGDGMYPTTGWVPGEVVADNIALRLDVPAGHYRLIAGLYRNDVDGFPRLSGPGGDFANLAEVVVR